LILAATGPLVAAVLSVPPARIRALDSWQPNQIDSGAVVVRCQHGTTHASGILLGAGWARAEVGRTSFAVRTRRRRALTGWPDCPGRSAAQVRAREQKRLAAAEQAARQPERQPERQPSLFGEDGAW